MQADVIAIPSNTYTSGAVHTRIVPTYLQVYMLTHHRVPPLMRILRPASGMRSRIITCGAV